MKFYRSTAAFPISKLATASIAAGLLLLAGCATTPQPAPVNAAPEIAPPPPQPEPQPEPVPEPAPTLPPTAVVAPPVETTAVQPVPHGADRLKIRIESVPSGAMIVVDGRPVGRSPVEFEVDAANNGFFRKPVTIRARFVADAAAGDSLSVDEEFGPLERVPLALVFSRDGVQRILRQY